MAAIETLPYLIWAQTPWTPDPSPHTVIKHSTPQGVIYECINVYKGCVLWISQDRLDIAIKVEQL